MSERDLTIKDRLEDILESIGLIEEWSQGMTELHDFMISPGRVMAFNACVMRLQVIGEHVGKLLKEQSKPLESYTEIPWQAIYGMRNIISLSMEMLMRQLWSLSSTMTCLNSRL